MPKATSLGEAYTPVSAAPGLQYRVPASVHNLGTSVPASGNVQSSLIETDGWPKVAIGVTSTQAGQVSVQRYLDDAGTVPQGAAVTASLTANTAAVVNVTDGNPFAAIQITITNTSGSTATLSNLAVLLST
jgi:hypothetical protein